MVLISVISIFKYLSKSSSIFLILLLSFMGISSLFFLLFFNTQPVVVVLLSSSNIWQRSLQKQAARFLPFFIWISLSTHGLFFLELFIGDSHDTYPKISFEKKKKNQKYFYYIGRSFLFCNTRTKLSTIIVGAVIKTITILLLVNMAANVKNCGWII